LAKISTTGYPEVTGGSGSDRKTIGVRVVAMRDARIRIRRDGSGDPSTESPSMPKYVIEREIPNAGKLSQQELKAISQTSCGVLRKLGSEIQWLESYVTDDKVYCVYIAPNEEMVREHARLGGFPANKISAVHSVISPTTAE